MSKSRGDIVQCAAPHDIEETNSGINQRGGGNNQSAAPHGIEKTNPGINQRGGGNNQSAAPHDIEKTNPGINQRGGPGIKKRAEPHGIEKTNPGINQRGSPGINQSAAPHGIEKTNLGINQSAAPHGIEKPDPGINQRGGPGGMAAPHGIENPNIQLGAWMEKELKLDIPSPVSPSRCIFRVPNRLRCEREKVVHYTPQVISIGPLHHGKEALKPMEEHKKRYVQYFMGRTNNFCLMKEYKKKIEKEEAKLRSCYSETIDLKKFESDEFVKIILVDAIFIIEFLFRNWYPKLLDENDCIFGKPRMVEDVWPDLLMLENQLPFFILEDLFYPEIFHYDDFDRSKGVERLSILYLSYEFLNGVPTFGGRSDGLEAICSSQVEHFVDLLRKLCIAPMLKEQALDDVREKRGQCALLSLGTKVIGAVASLGTKVMGGATSICGTTSKGAAKPLDANELEGAKYTTAPSIEELHQAGVKIRKRSTKDMFGIRFERHGILKIPKLKVDDRTEIILRNLVAFEQCAFISKNKSDFEECYISDYVGIMDQFVATSKDVKLLVKNKIVENVLGGGDDALSTMINSVSTGVLCLRQNSNLGYVTICEELNDFYDSNWNKSKANLRQNYFNTPWATISFCAAVILLILTVVQTICSIISLP